jgi:hypothetical protein
MSAPPDPMELEAIIRDHSVSEPSFADHATGLVKRLDAQRHDDSCPVPVAFLTGCAGTGKTTLIRQLIEQHPKLALLCATTGIAAVNLGTTTINSLLKYFDTDSLQDNFVRGHLAALLHKLGHEVEFIALDEVSMMPAEQLDILYRALLEVNGYESMAARGRKMGLVLTGDFCQLPPVKATWAFDAECWVRFAEQTIKLTKVWRHGNEEFLAALNLVRAGRGLEAAEALAPLVNWIPSINRDFDGTTVVAKNAEVDRHNWLALKDLEGPKIKCPARREGKQRAEWKLIPEALELKIGAYVMILANAPRAEGLGYFDFSTELNYANGDCGHVEGVNIEAREVAIRLVRNNATVNVRRITRENTTRDEPEEDVVEGFKTIYNSSRKTWTIGTVTYIPLRLAYAATVHKTQGLTLDRIQVDSRAHFFGSPAMAYVALSRARDAKNVWVVGNPKLFATKVKIDEKVRPWL